MGIRLTPRSTSPPDVARGLASIVVVRDGRVLSVCGRCDLSGDTTVEHLR